MGAVVALEQLWRLATLWYDDRLDSNWRRRSPEERQELLGRIGLTGEFWRLE